MNQRTFLSIHEAEKLTCITSYKCRWRELKQARVMWQKKVIARLIKRTFGVPFDEIQARGRTKELFFARCAFANLLLGTGMSLHMVGDVVNRDHSTVAYYKKQHQILMKQSPFYRECFIECKNDLDEIL